MLIMIPFALDEVIAMGQFLLWARRQGKPLIRTFFQGDAIEAGAVDASDAMASPSTFWADAKKGLTLPWTLTASIVIGGLPMGSEEHTAELPSLMRSWYPAFCLKKKIHEEHTSLKPAHTRHT